MVTIIVKKCEPVYTKIFCIQIKLTVGFKYSILKIPHCVSLTFLIQLRHAMHW